jgi:ergothioneine biosynthesis protein EgtB
MPADAITTAAPRLQTDGLATLDARYRQVRGFTEAFCQPLETEDYVVQTVEFVSPTKWHLAHTSWFFETFILQEHLPGYQPLDEQYAYLFNSYYIQAGERHCRDRRGYISRPTVAEVYAYRAHVDAHMQRLIETASPETMQTLGPLIDLGLHHEQQHQELMVTDLKHVLSVNPLRPAYRTDLPHVASDGVPDLGWVRFPEDVYAIGYDGDGFYYDNEGPRHKTYVQAYELANRLVTNGEYIGFIEDGGYERPDLWLSAGWATVLERDWSEPFYWEPTGEARHGRAPYQHFTLGGLRDVNPDAPVTHLSYFEADAFARWASEQPGWEGARLPREAEWEIAAEGRPVQGNFVDHGYFHPVPLARAADGSPDAEGHTPPAGDGPLYQLYGDVWEWTQSHYSPYPGYEPLPGAIGEYNGKFMCGQFVLRGGSCATSQSHVRPTYRNFFHPDESWQFMGLRLARDARG